MAELDSVYFDVALTRGELDRLRSDLAVPERRSYVASEVPTPKTEILPDDWEQLGACIGSDPSLFLPEKRSKKIEEAAKAVCDRCVVREPCYERAVNDPKRKGIQGGTNARERRRIREQRKSNQAND